MLSRFHSRESGSGLAHYMRACKAQVNFPEPFQSRKDDCQLARIVAYLLRR
jgi:hypothetical protein